MFDQLVILDVGGYLVYNGNPVNGIIYFKTLVQHVNPNESECIQCGNVNPEQIFNIIESKVVDEFGNLTRTRKISPKLWNEHYIEKNEYNGTEGQKTESKIPKSTFSIPNKLKQLKVFITRDVLSKLANKQYLAISLLEAPLLAVIFAWFLRYFNPDEAQSVYIFRENENMPVFMFAAIIVAFFIGMIVSAEEIIKDKKILKREAFLNLSRGSYLFSKISIMFVLSAIQAITFVLVGNWILEIQGMTMAYWLILFSTACMANMIGLNISSTFNSVVTIYIVIPFILMPHLILSGVMVKFDKLNPSIIVQKSVPLIGEIMVTKWAYEAMAVHQFKNNKFERRFYEYDKEKSIAGFKKNFWISELRAKIDRCMNNIDKPAKKEQVVNDLNFLHNEISKGFFPFQDNEFIMGKESVDSLTYEAFTSEIAKKAKTSLDHLFKYYMKNWDKADDAKEKIVSKRNSTPEGKIQYRMEKDTYTNDALTDLVENKKELLKYIVVDGEMIQQADPIYLDPEQPMIRAHFFAPRKKLFGTYYDTFWVNLLVIWMMSLVLVIALYYNLFKKFLDSTGELFSKLSLPIGSNNSKQ